MASVSGVSSSNMNSLYGNRNVMSGLASGLDTESMIENSVSGYRMRISGLIQRQTKLSWQQEAYRSITDKLVQFSRKYTSYSSATNLLSPSFFNRAVITTTNGANSDKITATGKSSSDIQINGVAQLAEASRYQINSGGVLDTALTDANGNRIIKGGETVDLGGTIPSSNMSGIMSIKYGNKTISLTFDDKVYKNDEDFLKAVQDQLKGQEIDFEGGTKTADEVIDVKLENGKLTFSDKTDGKNEVYISGLAGKIKDTFKDVEYNATNKNAQMDLNGIELYKETPRMDSIYGKSMRFSLDGKTKTIQLPTKEEFEQYMTDNPDMTREEALPAMIQDKLNSAFGNGKIKVDNIAGEDGKFQLCYTVQQKGSHLNITSTANTAMGMAQNETSALNTSRTLGELLGDKMTGGEPLLAEGEIERSGSGWIDSKGNAVNENGERIGKDGEPLYSFDLTINGAKIGTYTRDTAMESVMVDINNNTEANVSVNYSKTTNQFVFTSNETGEGHDIEIGSGLGEMIFGTNRDPDKTSYTDGKDAIVSMTVNGSELTVKRSSNNFDVDGLSITLQDTFNGSVDESGNPVFDVTESGKVKDPVTFSTKSDADKIVEAVKTMVEDYNAIMKELRETYSTPPAQKSNGGKYEPLTDSDLESMSESAIKNYEEKAKQGLLFADQDLSSLYNKLLSGISPGGTDGVALRNMGLGTTYTDGLTQIDFDETKFREALTTNPDGVRDAFTKVKGEGSATNGLMQTLKGSLDTYASVDGAFKGVLITKAGSKFSATSLLQNNLKGQIDALDKQIEKWQDKMSNKVDYYTRQFTQLEKLTAQMNEQSSSLMGMMGMG